jgi:putative ABC transport system substrate-binding protein
MRRRDFITLLAGAAAWPLAARAQSPQRVWRIGLLETTSPALNTSNIAALREGLRDLGYLEGQNLAIEYRWGDGAERFAELASELIRLKVDLIVLRGMPAALAAKNATVTIPIVIVSIADPLMVVPSLAHPGGNITGFSSLVSQLEPKRIEMIRELIPGAARMAALYNMANPIFLPRWQQLQQVAQSVGIQAQLLDVRKPEDLEPAFEAAIKGHADAVTVSNDGLMLENRKHIVGLAAKQRLPAIYAARQFVEAGGLVAYAVNFPDLYRRAATYVDKILKGASPADLPVQQPTKFELMINLKTARALGLVVPQTLLARADEVIE